MTERRKIYVIEQGEYSDYSVICAFEREEDAEAAVADGLGGDYMEMILFPPGHRPTKRITEWRANAAIFQSGSTQPPRVHAVEEWDSGDLVAHPQEELAGRPKVAVRTYYEGTEWGIDATGPDRESTLKACQDRYSKILAEREGL
jgi:hypothetical protein